MSPADPGTITEADIAEFVETFYRRVQADELLGPVFAAHIAAHEWPQHLRRMRDFWSTILLGTPRYRGNPVLAHRTVTARRREHFARWLELFADVAHELFRGEQAALWVSRAQRMGRTLQADLPAA